jgi:N-dimethylarginine dimethylaminohydrolase
LVAYLECIDGVAIFRYGSAFIRPDSLFAMVYTTLEEIDFSLEDCPPQPLARRVLFARPTHFTVDYVINPHMAEHVGKVDRERAMSQWKQLKDAYERLGVESEVVEGATGLPDMVFCANQTLPYLDPEYGEKGVVLSRMNAPQRRGEVQHFESFFSSKGHTILHLPDSISESFEGMGDAIWHPRRHLLWGGYGFRTGLNAYQAISELLDVRIIALKLDDPDFYHLDTAFSVLDERSVLICPEAFDEEGLRLIRHVFDQVIEAPEEEARRLFACNAHCPDGRHVIIQQGCQETVSRLGEAGFRAIEVETEEFLKSGGSVFCMKMMHW